MARIDKVFFEPLQKTYCKSCAKILGLIDDWEQSVSTCDGCGKRVFENSLSKINDLSLCQMCLDARRSLCPVCGGKIAHGSGFHSVCLIEYCNPCGKKLGLTRYIPPEDTSKIKTKSEQKLEMEDADDFRAELVPEDLSEDEVWRWVAGNQKTSWQSIFSEPPPEPAPKPAFSSNNYYHPEFDDNEEDDFVLDGIGGLDDKYDK